MEQKPEQINRRSIGRKQLIFLFLLPLLLFTTLYSSYQIYEKATEVDTVTTESRTVIEPEPITLCIEAIINSEIKNALTEWSASHEKDIKNIYDLSNPQACDIFLTNDETSIEGKEISNTFDMVHVAVVSFDSMIGEIEPIEVTDEAELLELYGDDVIVIPFNELIPELKSLTINGQNPLSKEFDPTKYPLTTSYIISGDEQEIGEEIVRYLRSDKNLAIYDPTKLTEVIVTGTSLVGVRTAWFDIRRHGDALYPVLEIAETLSSADLTHISNESVFSSSCIQEAETVVFCADLETFSQLEYIGADVVNLASNHILDWGYDDFTNTLTMYDQAEILTYGAGQNENEAREPAIIEVNGIRFGFLGYNFTPPFQYFATEELPGTSGSDIEKITADIALLRPQVDYIFVDMQWWQEYNPNPDQIQQETARASIDAGADFINGVQAHAVQGIEYYNDKMIFYGMGNLIFDQRAWEETRRGTIVQHYFYDGQYLGYRLLPTYIPNDLKVTFANDTQKEIVFQTIFQNSIYNESIMGQ